jgi:hypothetical protein
MARTLLAAVARHRRPILIGMVALVAGTSVARRLGADPDLLAPGLILIGTVGGLLYALTSRGSAGAFERDGASFRTPATAGPVIAGVAHLAWFGLIALDIAGPAVRGIPYPVLMALLPALFLLYPRALWHGVRLTLTPDGIRNEKYAGTVTVPWDALSSVRAFDPAFDPTPSDGGVTRLRLSFARPELVRVTGWTVNRRTLEFGGVSTPLVAAAIQHYVDHPGERALIGTAEGHGRLTAALSGVR